MKKYTWFTLSVVSIVVILILFPFDMWAQSGGRAGRQPQGRSQGGIRGSQGGPPPEALSACQGKQSGASCQFTSPQGAISGTCQTIQNQVACVPEGMGPGGQQGGPQQQGQSGQQQGPMSGGPQGGQQQSQSGQQRPMRPGGQQPPTGSQNMQTFDPFTEAISVSSTLPDTGQNRCYDARQEIACPAEGEAFYGQDAQYQSQTPTYQDNGDGTITDLVTGLMWQQDPGEKMTYDEAVQKAASFNLAGYTDWRLPTIKELYSLIQFSGLDVDPFTTAATGTPFIDTDYFVFQYGDASAGERMIDSQYISATKYVSTTMNGAAAAFGVNFADGRIKGYGYSANMRGRGQEKLFYVLYVRGNPDYGTNDFQDNGDGTITDNSTGLMWMQTDSGTGMPWAEALDYCENLDYAGYSDWRLPDAKELQSIVDYTRSPATTDSAAIDPIFSTSSIIDEGGNTNYPFYWTSTTHARTGGAESAAYIAFGEALGWMTFPQSGNATLMDVHGAGAQRSDSKSGNASDYSQGHGPQGDVVRINNYVRCVR